MNGPGRVLILYLSIGSGHLSAANALKKSIRQLDPCCRVFCEDLFTPGIRESIFPEFLSLGAALFFPKAYDTAWKTGSMSQGYDWLQSIPILKDRLIELIHYRKPDMVVCTHSLPCSILAGMRFENPMLPPVLAVATDFMVHPYWPVTGVEGFVVASQEAATRLIDRGASKERIRVYGIPIDPLAENILRNDLRNQTDGKSPIELLVLAGGKRLAPYVTTWPKTVNLLHESSKLENDSIKWNVVCGKPSAFSRLLRESVEGRSDVKFYEFVSDFLELLSRMDFVITKPGGLILAESMALGVPAILVNRGSGQEAANCEFIVSHGGGTFLNNEKLILKFLEVAAADPSITQKFKRAAIQIGKPDSARRTSEWILSGLTKNEA